MEPIRGVFEATIHIKSKPYDMYIPKDVDLFDENTIEGLKREMTIVIAEELGFNSNEIIVEKLCYKLGE